MKNVYNTIGMLELEGKWRTFRYMKTFYAEFIEQRAYPVLSMLGSSV